MTDAVSFTAVSSVVLGLEQNTLSSELPDHRSVCVLFILISED